MNDLDSLTIKDVVEEMEVCWDWDERYRYILELGRKLPPMPETAKTDENLIPGCQSTAWMISALITNGKARIRILADSDSQIVKGLIAILYVAYSGHTVDEIAEFDIEDLFERLELRRHLSPVRGNGLLAIVRKIKELAASAAGNE